MLDMLVGLDFFLLIEVVGTILKNMGIGTTQPTQKSCIILGKFFLVDAGYA